MPRAGSRIRTVAPAFPSQGPASLAGTLAGTVVDRRRVGLDPRIRERIGPQLLDVPQHPMILGRPYLRPSDAPLAGGGLPGGGPGPATAPTVNPDYPGMPVNAVPVHYDVTVSGAGTTTIWTPAIGKRFVLVSAFLSTDAAMRLALVDELDVVGQRPFDGFFGANGGASPNLVPVPYPSVAIGNRLRLVTGGAGNVKAAVSGWEVAV